ncbi:YciI family protein [Fundidesulfovibrio agrisoli]|uniref:YciI family protein n=1 Tax=Fundidesulfovibrio agrisoli TaxID=2922717 RepID=UPI001FAB662C|nr:YciI family protein [Fundidesulfovibrio agrisoli]
MADTQTFLMLFKAKRENFIATMTPEEQAVMEAHGAHCHALAAQGRVVLLGVCPDGAYGVMVFRAESEEEARRFFDEDPAVQAGVVQPELRPFLTVMPG